MSDIFWEPYPLVAAPAGFKWAAKVPGFPFVPLSVVYMRLTRNIARSEPLDEESFDTLRQTLLAYIQSEYTYGLAESNAPCTSSIQSCLLG